MEHWRSFWKDHPYCVVGVVSVPLVYVIVRKFRGHCKRPEIVCPPNTVHLCQMSRGPYAPSMSNFPLKLETYLRMANIPYINDCCGKMSPKGKTPFMVYNGEVVSDSQFCIEYLNKKLSVDLNKNLSKEERAVAKAIQVMVDEHLYWTLVYFRWVYDKDLKMVTFGFPEFTYDKWLFKRILSKEVYGQGIGRHTTDEIKHIMMIDLQATADYLGRTFGYFRWVYDKDLKVVSVGIPEAKYFAWLIRRSVAKTLYGQGIGRHTTEEIKHIMMADFEALSDYLGNKPFIMGQTPCEVDCSAFGLLSQFIWHVDDDICNNIIQEKFPTLNDYCLRMKERFWPDWDDCITHGGTRPATK